MATNNISGLASSLATRGLLPFDKLQQITSAAQQDKKSLVSYLVDNKFIDSLTLAEFFEIEYGLPLLDASILDLDEIPEKFLNNKLIEKHHALPVYVQDKTLYIAMSDPTNIAALEDFAFSFAIHTDALLVEEQYLAKAIETVLEDDVASLGEMSDIEDIEVDDSDSRLDEAQGNGSDDAPIVKYINSILLDAVRKGASDLHFEPYEKTYRIRFRVDGILHQVATPPVNLANRFSARLKVMSKLDIAERRLPQDGRIKLKITNKRSVDLRVSTLPTMWGEKVVMRILDSSGANLNIDSLGYNDKQKESYLSALAKPQGMILITGPTGSGKTVSLYSGLNILNTVQRNISTAEDPVEINLSGINQVQINTKAGLTFASALRSFLRQDPDILMVGEIRDLETAEIAIKAAQTGHMVLSTLHTNSAAETLTRLLNMGVPAFNVASSVSLIIAQRLARRLCPECKTEEVFETPELKTIGFTETQIAAGITLYKPVGCSKCTEGYKGRVGIYEVMQMSETIGHLILNNGNAPEIAKLAEAEGMDTLRQSALQQVLKGITSLTEVTRVT
ncbi:type IV-A pilus assembly ATPase PilB [Psychromonas ingrahamii 37]|uniref:Type IV-A pilus assembly ATPase PilB n=1 Tax=Psychromonas ingrahamii (strain DSM 17664 / CCUG 51855 / 37) TaxID=357804 RepID=A1SS72_PSYIN|nr:type IV-A pilus assembly ATPase PilB [Psychromonas ingrahamii]ABM02337.1 type IV-A pilus assembly ATPase PilB [Psychromonas ingrahamii 37]